VATTLTTNSPDAIRRLPYMGRVLQLFHETAFAPATTKVSAVLNTIQYCTARVHVGNASLAANSTITIRCQSGPSTDMSESVFTTTGGAVKVVSSTVVLTLQYPGLNRYTSFVLTEAGGAANSTGIVIDVELV